MRSKKILRKWLIYLSISIKSTQNKEFFLELTSYLLLLLLKLRVGVLAERFREIKHFFLAHDLIFNQSCQSHNFFKKTVVYSYVMTNILLYAVLLLYLCIFLTDIKFANLSTSEMSILVAIKRQIYHFQMPSLDF